MSFGIQRALHKIHPPSTPPVLFKRLSNPCSPFVLHLSVDYHLSFAESLSVSCRYALDLTTIQLPLLLFSAAVLCPKGEAVLLLCCVNERGCQCCYLGDLQGAVSALNSTGPDTVSAALSAATRLIQSVFGKPSPILDAEVLRIEYLCMSPQASRRLEGWFQSSGSLLLCDVLNRSVELDSGGA
ncbi:hypothetical protein QQF64_027292 [Cirrhinus molitorella]|uniref:Uncharacterized protein n=1 Tax=Cirrhinus molitorella TaxID=172907 RepID=A0ABR3NCK6_9TELE